MNYTGRWYVLESPPGTGNCVCERGDGPMQLKRALVDKSQMINSRFGKIAPLKAAQFLCDRLNKKTA